MRLAQYVYSDLENTLPKLAVWNRPLGAWIDADIYLDGGDDLDDFDEELSEDDDFFRMPLSIDDFFTNAVDEEIIEELTQKIENPNADALDLNKIQFLSPFLWPSKILCVGLNYADHAAEFNDPVPAEPVFFCKANSSLSSHQSPILLPSVSDQIDYEAELVVIIGRAGRDIPESEALDYVFGYTCGNDVSCRDWQSGKPAGQWFLGKSFDSFAPIGPGIVTKDEIPNPNHLAIASRLNGKTMQSSNTSNFIFPVEKLIAYVSQVMTLKPGDLLFTGTPGGVGMRRNPPVFLKNGDTIEVEIENIGTLTNPVLG